MTTPAASSITPGLLYENAGEALTWLCDTFGLEERLVVPGEDGTILHAHLTLGAGSIMITSSELNEHPDFYTHPAALGGVCSHGINVHFPDDRLDAHYAKAQVAGAQILLPLEPKEYGGRGYSCRDIGGYVWYFGSYDPWA